MSDNNRSSQGLLPGLAIGALTLNSAMPSRTEEPPATLSTLLYLVSVGLVAAVTIIIFGIASFSLLSTNEGMPRGSGIRDRGVEVKSVRSGVFLYTRANRPPLPAETELPGPAAEATPSTSPPGNPAARDMQTPEVSGAQPVAEPLPPGATEGGATQDTALSGTVSTRAPEVIGAQPVSEPLPPGASEESAKQDAALIGTVPKLANLDGDNAASHEKIPIQHSQQGQSRDHYFSANAAFWRYHVRKECGPIKDPALHGDCVRSFRAQYPIRYAIPSRTHEKS